jgi:hypothetical protein
MLKAQFTSPLASHIPSCLSGTIGWPTWELQCSRGKWKHRGEAFYSAIQMAICWRWLCPVFGKFTDTVEGISSEDRY